MQDILDAINIRKIRKADISAISKMFIKQGWDGREVVLNQYFEEQKLGSRLVIVAEYKESIVGYVTLLTKANQGPFKDKYPEVADFNVFEEYQQFGIGNKLLENIENKAMSFSEIITIGVGMHKGYGPAQRLYVKRGYIPDGTGIWYKNKNIEINDNCVNNDELAIYLSKSLK